MSIVGKAETQPSELISKEVRDANGDVCAGLIIATDLDDLKFDSYNGIVKMDADKPGRYFLFLSPDERVVTIYKTGFKPLKLILSEIGISKMESGKVWQLIITGEKKVDYIPVSILIEPTVDEIIVDGKKQASARSYQLLPGDHSLRIEKEGFKILDEKIIVSLSKTNFTFKLTEVELVGVTIRSLPSNAKIFIDSVEKGITDKGIFLYPGKFKLKIAKSGYLDIRKIIEVKETEGNVFVFKLERSATGVLIVRSPADARVFINREDYTGKDTIELAEGKYNIDIEKAGYNQISEFIEVLPGKTIIKQYTFGAGAGSLQFNVTPVDARVKLVKNGVEVLKWTGIKMQKGIDVGDYMLEVRAPGYISIKKQISIEEGNAIREDIALMKRYSIDTL
ncbi:MAG: PEGA domain-containing protein, partial [Bacteroidota bacterium]